MTSQSHLVLARKYRPKILSELVGQDVFVKTISNAITTNKIHHAFLLTGTRGVGKTSSARILALSLNCKKADGPTLTPCLECDCCREILNGSNPDVIEFDAASNTGKSEIHDNVIDKVNYAPIMSRYKIYIIDEVHMLSKAAFNALLKTLEEPPERVKFIFATTEVRKVPITILSRCQKFYLKNIPEDVIFGHLKSVCDKERVIYDDDSLKLVAKYANGSMRDGLSLLDQAISITNSNLEISAVSTMLSIPSRELVARMFKYCYIGDIKQAMEVANEFISGDIESASVVNELMEVILDGLKIASGVITKDETCHEFANVLGEQMDADNLNIPRLLRMWQILSASLQEMKTIQAKQYFTALIYKLCYSSTLPTPVESLKLIKDELLQETLKQFPEGKVVK